ncbi:MAG: sugar-transfer associated ATP-grasp domain-containing protein [Kiloniellaceae bacterium]
MREIAKVVWHWRSLVPQIISDYRFHKLVRGLPTAALHRFAEQLRLLWSNRITAKDYYKFGLFDRSMPLASKRSYVGEFQPWKILAPVNARQFHDLTDNKLRFHAYAAEAGLPIADKLATVSVSDSGLRVPDLNTETELGTWLTENAIADVFLKPVEGLMGTGVLSLGERIDGQDCWRSLPGGETIDVAGIWAHCTRQRRHGGMIVERRLRPHPDLARVMPNVLHTVRVVTYLEPEPTIVDAVLRVGRGNAAADNMHAGGIAVPIDLATGQCGQGTLIVDGRPQFIDAHPLTGHRITGMFLPDWPQVLALSSAAARKFDIQKSLGWDIGLTDAGPMLVEGNWRYDVGLHQVARRQGILDTPWVRVFNREGAYRNLSLGFFNRPRA